MSPYRCSKATTPKQKVRKAKAAQKKAAKGACARQTGKKKRAGAAYAPAYDAGLDFAVRKAKKKGAGLAPARNKAGTSGLGMPPAPIDAFFDVDSNALVPA